MKNDVLYIIFLGLFSCQIAYGQTTISGNVYDKNGPIIGANIFVVDSYDGSTTDLEGNFNFKTDLSGAQSLSISFLGYETKIIKGDIGTFNNLKIKLRESALSLDAVTISASTFKAGDNSKVAVLNALDVVTTAGSNGDVIASLQTLPGTQANADDGRLFVRGGDARETKIYIDGLRVFSPYTRTIAGTPSRGRYSPFLFKGLSFSTGGYASSFGQALSGILDMNTIDEAQQNETNISLMTVGLGLGKTLKGDKNSISLSASYIDLSPYQWLVPGRLDWNKPYRGFSGEAVYRQKTKNGLIKSYIAGDLGGFSLNSENINTDALDSIDIKNHNLYSNTTYKSILNDKTSIHTGISVGINSDKFEANEFNQEANLFGVHGKVEAKTIVNDHFILNYGTDVIYQENTIDRQFGDSLFTYNNDLARSISALYGDFDYFFTKNLAIKGGIRLEYQSINSSLDLSPRVTIAQKLSKHGQMSFAYGKYSQEVNPDYLYENRDLSLEEASHYLFNYNYKNDAQIIRLEAYYKDYQKLLRYEDFETSQVDGDGYAYGFDVFWRASKLVKNFDFWISYSWLENKRNYEDYPVAATPNYSTRHNLSIVGKKWFPRLKSQLSMTYRFASGRPYDDPHSSDFMNELSRPYHSINASWAYLITQQKILFLSVSNLTNFKNNYGYQFADSPDANGLYRSSLITPNADQFFFIGFFITMSEDKAKNQLDSL